MVFNAIFNNISTISWQSVLSVEKTGVPGENLRPAASHWQTPDYNGYLQQRGITCYLHRKADLVKLCELAQELQLEIATLTNDYVQSHVTLFFLNFAFLFCPGNVKKIDIAHVHWHISHASLHLIYTVKHSTNPLNAWVYPYYYEKRFNYNYVKHY